MGKKNKNKDIIKDEIIENDEASNDTNEVEKTATDMVEVKEEKVEKPVEEETDKTESVEKPEGLSDADRARKAAYVEVLKDMLNEVRLENNLKDR